MYQEKLKIVTNIMGYTASAAYLNVRFFILFLLDIVQRQKQRQLCPATQIVRFNYLLQKF